MKAPMVGVTTEGDEMTTIERELFDIGWVRSPNNPHGLPSADGKGASPVWYATRGKRLPFGLELQVMSDRLRVFSLRFFGEHYSRRSFWDTVTVEVFADVAEFVAWFATHAVDKPEGGANVWD